MEEKSIFMPYLVTSGSPTWLPRWMQGIPEGVDLSVYWTMLKTDPVVGAGISFLKLSILGRLQGYQHYDPQVQEFVELSLTQMERTLHDVIDDLLSALWAGFAVAEIVYQAVDGHYLWQKIKVVNPTTIYPNGIETDEKGKIKRIVQRVGMDEVELPLERCIIWSFASEFGNPWGSSLLRPAYAHWLTKQIIMRLWGTHLERQATPLVLAQIPQAEMPVWCPVHQREERYIEAMRHILEDLKNRTSLVYTGGAEIAFQPIESRGELFETAIRYHDIQILRALLIPSLLVSEAEYGTRAQAVVHQEAFEMMLSGIIRELKVVLEEQLFRPLLELNFGAMDDYGVVVFRQRGAEAQQIVDAVFRLASLGMIHWSRDDEDMLREKLGLPPLPEEAPKASPPPEEEGLAGIEETYPEERRG